MAVWTGVKELSSLYIKGLYAGYGTVVRGVAVWEIHSIASVLGFSNGLSGGPSEKVMPGTS